MKIEVNIPEFILGEPIKRVWERGFTIETLIDHDTIIIKANEAGLKSLAQQLLTLAQTSIPIGSHMHYDSINSLENESFEMIIEKI